MVIDQDIMYNFYINKKKYYPRRCVLEAGQSDKNGVSNFVKGHNPKTRLLALA